MLRAINSLKQLPEPEWATQEDIPYQGQWSEDEYLALQTSRRIEFCNGYLEVLSMPNMVHEYICRFIYELLSPFVRRHQLGEVFFVGPRVKTIPTAYRVPDVVFLSAGQLKRMRYEFWEGADLAVEIVSPSA